MAYRITASYTDRNGRSNVDCTRPEVLGETHVVVYTTREAADEAVATLTASIADYGLDPSTRYRVEEHYEDE